MSEPRIPFSRDRVKINLDRIRNEMRYRRWALQEALQKNSTLEYRWFRLREAFWYIPDEE